MNDALSSLLDHLSLQAGVFYTGTICGIHDFESDAQRAHLHVIRRGPIDVLGVRSQRFEIVQPSLLLLPRPKLHRLVVDEKLGADVVCATVSFGRGGRNPISDSLPELVMIELSELSGAEQLLSLIFEESASAGDPGGRQGIVDRLCEVLMIQVLRHCLTQGLTQAGVLTGLHDNRLAPVLRALHERPADEWDLEGMARLAGLSRARFSARFKEAMGQAPMDYLVQWRVCMAQSLMREGRPLKVVAEAVGYAHSGALAKAFRRKVGVAPSEWLKSIKGIAA